VQSCHESCVQVRDRSRQPSLSPFPLPSTQQQHHRSGRGSLKLGHLTVFRAETPPLPLKSPPSKRTSHPPSEGSHPARATHLRQGRNWAAYPQHSPGAQPSIPAVRLALGRQWPQEGPAAAPRAPRPPHPVGARPPAWPRLLVAWGQRPQRASPVHLQPQREPLFSGTPAALERRPPLRPQQRDPPPCFPPATRLVATRPSLRFFSGRASSLDTTPSTFGKVKPPGQQKRGRGSRDHKPAMDAHAAQRACVPWHSLEACEGALRRPAFLWADDGCWAALGRRLSGAAACPAQGHRPCRSRCPHSGRRGPGLDGGAPKRGAPPLAPCLPPLGRRGAARAGAALSRGALLPPQWPKDQVTCLYSRERSSAFAAVH